MARQEAFGLGFQHVQDVTIDLFSGVEPAAAEVPGRLRSDEEQPQAAGSAVQSGRRAVRGFEREAGPVDPALLLLHQTLGVPVGSQRFDNGLAVLPPAAVEGAAEQAAEIAPLQADQRERRAGVPLFDLLQQP
jgi:hypothetical protein